MSAPGPIHVAVIDVCEPITDLDCRRDGESPYVAAWILAAATGRPLGSIELPLDGTRISAERLERELAERSIGGDSRARMSRPLHYRERRSWSPPRCRGSSSCAAACAA